VATGIEQLGPCKNGTVVEVAAMSSLRPKLSKLPPPTLALISPTASPYPEDSHAV